MSENIQSIANGTYTIGNTNELTFSAGPGIKLDTSVAGVIGICEDRTVLFEDTNETGADSGDISEAYTNFEILLIEVGYGLQSSDRQDGYIWVMCSTRSPYTWVQYTFGSGGNNHYYATAKIQWTSSTHFSVTNGSSILHNETATTVSGNTSYNANVKKCVLRIIGINRISGGN